MAPKTLLIGPDASGLTVVIAGDRVCFSRNEKPPRFAGAKRLDVRRMQLSAPRVLEMPMAWARTLRNDREGPAALLKGPSVATAVILDLDDESSPSEVTTTVPSLLRCPLRVHVIARLESQGSPRPRLRAILELASMVSHPRFRSAIVFEPEHARNWHELPEAEGGLAGDAAALGISLFTAKDLQLFGSAASLLGRMMGRPFGTLEEGAVGDVLGTIQDQAELIVIGGEVLWPPPEST